MKKLLIFIGIAAGMAVLAGLSTGCKTNDSGWPVIPFMHNNNPN